jgi:hypothetical protein
MARFTVDGGNERTVRVHAFSRLVRALAGCIAASMLLIAGCSLGGGGAEFDDDATLQLTDPCEPACCCRAKDNYYIRYRCAPRIQCMSDGGECTTENLGKCRSDANLGE